MRKILIMALPLSAMLLTACGPKKLALSEDPIDRAATCAVVSAAAARSAAPALKGGLDFGSQTRIIHYAMLAGTDDKGFSAKRTAAVIERMSALQETVTEGKWQKLAAPCDAAFPEVKKTAGIELPAGQFDAELGCYAMGDFLSRSVTTSDDKGQAVVSTYSALHRKLDGPIGSALRARGATKVDQTQALKNVALGKMTRLGAPVEVMKICTGRFA